jgi:hypothetical protein
VGRLGARGRAERTAKGGLPGRTKRTPEKYAAD